MNKLENGTEVKIVVTGEIAVIIEYSGGTEEMYKLKIDGKKEWHPRRNFSEIVDET